MLESLSLITTVMSYIYIPISQFKIPATVLLVKYSEWARLNKNVHFTLYGWFHLADLQEDVPMRNLSNCPLLGFHLIICARSVPLQLGLQTFSSP